MVDTKTALAQLGWRVDTSARLAQAVKDFQRMWNLGPALVADGVAGPATRAALGTSLARRAARQPDISEHFSALEFACNCDGRWSDCRRIWTPRYVVRMAEQYRALVGPYTPDRACRCPRENARVGGVSNSQHLYGLALDVPLYAVTAAQVRSLGTVSGIGVYLWNGRRYVRHIDARHLRGSTSTPTRPATWDYGTAKSPPLTPAPERAVTPPAPTPVPAPAPVPSEEDELMAMQIKHPTLDGVTWDLEDALWSMWTYSVRASEEARAARTETTALKAAVGVLANSQGVDPGLIAKTIQDAVDKAMSEFRITRQEPTP